jgi:transposase InsO family protein
MCPGKSHLRVRARTPASGLIGIRMVIRGIRLQTWTRVIVNRCIGKIIARDLSLVARRLYRMAVTRPQSRVAVTLSPSLGADLLGCMNRTREKERKGKKYYTFIVRTYSYEIISPATNWYSSMATFRQIRRTGKLHIH